MKPTGGVDSRFAFLADEHLELGDHRLRCPACADQRKYFHQKDVTLNVTVYDDRVVFKCWHCPAKGAVPLRDTPQRIKPKDTPNRMVTPLHHSEISDLNRECLRFLKDRGISLETAAKCGLRRTKVRGTDAIAFPYYTKNEISGSYNENEISGYKCRSIEIPKREGAYKIIGKIGGLFLGHLVDPNVDQLVICEGEFDPLACYEAGIVNAVSIPHGAMSDSNNPDNSKLACLAEAASILKGRKRITIATDGDSPGKVTGDEIARRVGRWRAYRVAWPNMPKPDANQVLMDLGPGALRNVIELAVREQIPGLAKIEKYKDDIWRLRNGELLRGESTGYDCVDSIYRMAPIFTTVTGYPNSGKTRFVNQITMNAAMRRGCKFGAWSREMPGSVFAADLIEMYAKKRFHPNMNNVMTDEELEAGYNFVNDHATILESDGEPDTMESILERGTAAVMADGIEYLTIDPYNYITKNSEVAREDLQISDMLTLGTDWVNDHGCGIFFIAHPRTLNPDVVPTGHHISGGGTFNAKSHAGLTVFRDDYIARIVSWKAKFAWLGKLGQADLAFDSKTGSYYDPDLPLPVAPARYEARYVPPVPDDDDFEEPRLGGEGEL